MAKKTETASADTASTTTAQATGAAPNAQAGAADAKAVGWSLEITSPPFIVGGVAVKRLAMAPQTFVHLQQTIERARLAQSLARDTGNWRRYFMRERIRQQLRAYDASGNEVKISDLDLMQMPRVYAAKLYNADVGTGSLPGSVLTDGDGITQPVLYRFGTPLRTGSDGVAIEEVEFVARTLADIEDVLCAETNIEKTIALVARCAKPIGIGADLGLQQLPSWAVDQLASADGFKIMEVVLPRFLEAENA